MAEVFFVILVLAWLILWACRVFGDAEGCGLAGTSFGFVAFLIFGFQILEYDDYRDIGRADYQVTVVEGGNRAILVAEFDGESFETTLRNEQFILHNHIDYVKVSEGYTDFFWWDGTHRKISVHFRDKPIPKYEEAEIQD